MKRIAIIILVLLFFGCKDKLDLKPNTSIVIPSTAGELESILENITATSVTPGLNNISADEYFVRSQAAWESTFYATERNASIWRKDVYQGENNIIDWDAQYEGIFYANSVLDILNSQDISTDKEKKRIKGRALFIRGYAFYSLACVFAKSYNEETADNDLGIPLKLTSGVEQIVQRSTIRRTYDQIISDILNAAQLLNEHIIDDKKNKPSLVACYAFLSRVYLCMRKYDLAETYAGKALDLYSVLTDFNSLNQNVSRPFTYNTVETIYFSYAYGKGSSFYSTSPTARYGINPIFMALYNDNDLRKSLYFTSLPDGSFVIKAINTEFLYPFTGLATDELYLIKAECLARRGLRDESMTYLNKLLATRARTNTFVPIVVSNAAEALETILKERIRALMFRGTRWTDIKRLNLEGKNIILTRSFSGNNYTLVPNSNNYILPIPNDEVALSGLQQNPRE